MEKKGEDATPEELTASANEEELDKKEVAENPEVVAVETGNTIQEAQKNIANQKQRNTEFDQRSADREALNFLQSHISFLGQEAQGKLVGMVRNNKLKITPDVIAKMRKVEQEFPRGSGVWREAGRRNGSALQRAAYEARSRLDNIVSIL